MSSFGSASAATSGKAAPAAGKLRVFSLTRWFTTVGLVAIALLALIGALLLSRLFEERMLRQEGELTMQFVQGIIDLEGAASYFGRTQTDRSTYMERLLSHIERAPDVLRTNLYSREKLVIWSSDPRLAGRSFAGEENEELDAALAGELEIHAEEPGGDGAEKAEHSFLPADGRFFVELYIPVWDPDRRAIVGAVELYRAPRHLRETIDSGIRMIWVGALGAVAVLFLALLPLVRRADALIRAQKDQIVEAETLAAMGDLGSAVAHGIRNPLSVIRTSAEIVREGVRDEARREAATDIMEQVDRLELWVRELLTYVHLPAGERLLVDVEAVARAALAPFEADLRRRGVAVGLQFAGDLPQVRGDAILLGQVLRSLITNAVEAMPEGGRLQLTGAVREGGLLSVEVRDSGVGMSEEQLARALKPFHTTKTMGLGVGLPLARRIVERIGGRITLSSRIGVGTTVELSLPGARP